MEQPGHTITIELKVEIAGKPTALSLTVPSKLARPRVMLPVFQQVTQAMVERGEQDAVDLGETISCAKGCGACCRQLIPVTEIEAYHLRELIDQLPHPQRDALLARFASAASRLESEGLLAALQEPQTIAPAQLPALSTFYFSLGIPCPFLQDESCSIHLDRPMVCREYLVTSPASCCSDVNSDSIRRVRLPGVVSNAVSSLGAKPGQQVGRWVPLITTPHWTATHPEPPATRTGPDILNEVFGRLWGKPSVAPAGS